MNNAGLNAYRSNEVTTAGKLQLVAMMYDGAIRFMKECKTRIETGDISGRGMFISKAQRIIGELQVSINKSSGGEVAESLEKVYDLTMGKLTQANISGEVVLVEESIKMIEELRSAWSDISKPSGNSAINNGNTKVAVNL